MEKAKYYEFIGTDPGQSYITGKHYEIRNPDNLEEPENFIDEQGVPNGYSPNNHEYFKPVFEEFVLPDKWCIKNYEEHPEIGEWWDKQVGEGYITYSTRHFNSYLHSYNYANQHILDSNILTKRHSFIDIHPRNDYSVELTFKQFQKYVLNKPSKLENTSYLIELFDKYNIK
jgi:hypothetical protein